MRDIRELKYLQSLPLERKIEMTAERIDAWYHNYENDITNYLVTEERTGYYCGTINDLQKPELWKKFIENIKSIPSVTDLPLAVMRDGEYVIQEADDE